jgi:hypothetical protein
VAGLPVPRAGVFERGGGRQSRAGAGGVLGVPRPALPEPAWGLPDEKLLGLAREAGLDAERFEADLASGEYEQIVSSDFREGQQRGISGTPTFVINGRVLSGLQPAEVYEDAIEQAKREAEGGT